MKRRTLLLIAASFFVFLQLLSFIGPSSLPRLEYPFATKTNTCNEVSDFLRGGQMRDDTCSCTLKGIRTTGFPFITNQYDSCGQDENIVWSIELVNMMINLLIASGVFFLARYVVTKSSK
jgi:hypothetical protein